MPRLYKGPVIARAEVVDDASGIKLAEGETGVLVLYESVRKYPGKHFAAFYYEPGAYPCDDDQGFETSRYLITACGDLEILGDAVKLTNESGDVHIFKLCGGEISESGSMAGGR